MDDAASNICQALCSGIVCLLHVAPEKLTPNRRDVITYMLERTNDGDEDVALESCEFWVGRVRIVLASSSTTYCTRARHVIHHTVYRCSPRHPPHSVPVLATSSTT